MYFNMDANGYLIFSFLIYKLSSLIVGILSMYMGFKLFVNGIWGHSGDMIAKFKDNKLILKNAAPGTFFSVLGAVIICFTIFKGLKGDYKSLNDSISNTSTEEQTSIINDDLNIPVLPNVDTL